MINVSILGGGMNGSHFERALFVLGEQNTGKSTQLRSMFLDWRLGNSGKVPTTRNVRNTYALSNERWLYLRLTSPHEAGETTDEFHAKCVAEMAAKVQTARRWNFAGAIQITASATLPSGPEVVKAFAKRFEPERMRVAILSPDRHGNSLSIGDQDTIVKALRSSGAEVVSVDATSRTANGLLYADFFDFT